MLVGRLIYNAITYFTRFCTSGKHFKVQYIRLLFLLYIMTVNCYLQGKDTKSFIFICIYIKIT